MNYEQVALYSQVASAVLFVLVMIWIWVKFIQPAVLSAQQNQNATLAEAERHRDEAKKVLDSLQGEIDSAKRDADNIRRRVEAQAAAERDVAINEAREAGDRTLRNAREELGRSRAGARDQLREELASRALQLARNEAQHRVDGKVNAALVGSFLENLEHGGRN